MVLNPLAERWQRLFRETKLSRKAYYIFCTTHPYIQPQSEKAEWGLLLAYLRKSDKDYVAEIDRFNVYSVMLTSVSLGFVILAIVHIAYFFVINTFLWPLIVVGVALLLSVLAARQSAKFGAVVLPGHL